MASLCTSFLAKAFTQKGKTMDFTFDVFLSHSSKDKAIIRPLAERLQDDGVRVWFDEWSIPFGAMIPAAIEDGLKNSRCLVLCMSANATDADWVNMEQYSFRFKDTLNRDLRFLPLRLDNADLKISLSGFKYIDWRDKTEQAYQQLLGACLPSGSVPSCLLGELSLATIANACPRGDLQLDFVDERGSAIHHARSRPQAKHCDSYSLRLISKRSGDLLLISQGTDRRFRLLHPTALRAPSQIGTGEYFLPGELLPLPNAVLGPDITRLYFADKGKEAALALVCDKLPNRLQNGEALAEISAEDLRKILLEAWPALQAGKAELAIAHLLVGA